MSQEVSEHNVQSDSSNKSLKVTLLGDGWTSSAGGLSTLNRELAIHLSQHPQVDVSFLVPDGHCTDEDKNEAQRFGITVVSARERPGSKPLEWLSAPPRGHKMDVVIGHGAKLGKQVPFIKDSAQHQNCKWVQVVHTAPEDLSKYKGYSDPISKGEQKHEVEVALCRLADLVVPVGPRLEECYSAYLKGSKRDMFPLIPGLFDREFGGLEQSPNENAEFKVLLCGRGDKEDFELKGYNIAAKAFTDHRLQRKPYHLLFVGAPEGKQEEVRRKLLQCGIAEDQLTVRKFVQSRKKMRDLLCEVNLAIMPSRSEAFGLVALEALSAGLPILVNSKSGFARALENIPFGKPCILDSNEPAKWAESIEGVRLRHKMWLKEIKMLRTSYGEQYSWKEQFENFVGTLWTKVHGSSTGSVKTPRADPPVQGQSAVAAPDRVLSGQQPSSDQERKGSGAYEEGKPWLPFALMDMFSILLKKFLYIFPESFKGFFTGKSSEGATNFPKVQFNEDDKEKGERFASVVHYCEREILKPWSDSQDRFIVLICHSGEDLDKNPINFLSVISTFAFEQGNTTCLEEIQRIAVDHQNCPNAGLLMNNLGVMFEEKALYLKSEDCFTKAKNCFEHEQDHLCRAVAMFNLAALHKVFGEYQQACHFCTEIDAAALCHDISMRTTKDVNLLERVLRRAVDLLEELEDSDKLCNILEMGIQYGICGTSEKQLMSIQLKKQIGENTEEELRDFTCFLSTLMDKQVPELLNADFMGTVMTAAKVNRETGYSKKANKLVEKLKSTFLSTRGSKYPLYGLVLLEVGHFKFGSGMVSEARSALKEADKILTNYFGGNHHVIASCKILMGSCTQQEGNNEEARKHFSEALTFFRKINHQHLEVGEICLKFANLYIEEGKFQLAKETVQEAVEIFNRVCGEASFKTATGYIKAGVILQKFDEFQDEAADRLTKAIDIYRSRGLRPDHPYVMFCQRLLGNILLMSGKSEAAEQCLVDVQKQAPLADESYSRKSQCHHVFGTAVNFSTDVLSAECFIRQHLYLSAEIFALINLVHLKKGHDRQCYLDALVCSLNKNKTESVEILDFFGHNVYVSHREYCSTPVYVFISLDPEPSPSQFMDDGSNSNRVTLSRSKNSSCVLFWRSSSSVQEMKETKSFDVALRESVSTLFLQPKFRKTFEEKRDFYMELAIPTKLSDSYSLSSQIDYLPLLLERNVTDLSQEIASFSSEPLAHVSTFCFKFHSQRTAEFAFDHLIHKLSQHLALETVQVVEISSEPTLKNIAFFPFQQDSFSSLSAVVYTCSDLPVLAVKCRSLRESKSNCICSAVQTSLGKVMQSLSEQVRVNFETFVQLRCEDVGARSINESINSNCSSCIKPSSADFASETVQLLFTSATSGDPEAELETKQSARILQSQDVEGVHPVIYSDVSVCLHLLDYVLSERTVLPEEEAVNSHAVSSFTLSSFDSNSHCNHCSDNSLLSACSASSLNSLPTFSESGPFDPNTCKSCSNTQPFTHKLMGKNLQPLTAQNDAEDFSCIKHVSESSCSADLHVNLPFESSDGVAWSSSEEALITGEIIPDLKPSEQLKQKEYVHQSQTTSSKGNPGIPDSKQGVQGAHATGDFDFKNGLWRESTKHVDMHLEPNQQTPSQISSELSSSASAGIDEEYLRNDCPGDSLPNLEDVLREYINRLEDQTNKLEEQLKKSEEDKKQLQAELGRYLFLEDKQRRSGERQSLSRVSGSDKARLCAAGASPVSRGADSVGGADPLQESSLTRQTKLLEISDSLTADELKRMKFLAKGKVDGFKLARIRVGFELFEELETDGEYPLTFIWQLLEGIERFDLQEKLGLPLSGIVRSDRTTDAGMVEQTNGSPENSGNSSEPLELRDSWDMEAERQDTSTADQTSHALTRKSCNVQSLPQDEAKSKPENLNGLVLSGGSSHETSNDIPSVFGTTGSCASSRSQSGLNAGKKQFWDCCDDNSMSDSSLNTSGTSSNSTVRSGLSTQTPSDGTSHDSSDSSSRLSSVTSHSAAATNKISSDGGCNTTSSEDEIIQKSQLLDIEDNVSESGDAAVAGACAANSEDIEKNSLDSCDGPVTPSNVRMTVLDSEVNYSTDNSVDGRSRAQSSSDARNGPPLQQSLFDHDETVVDVSNSPSTDWERLGARPKQGRMQRQPPLPAGGVSSGSNTDWEHLGARPKLVQIQCQPPESVPQKIIRPLSDGLTGDFIARHSQDSALHQSLYRDGPDLSLFNEAPLRGASFSNSILNASESNAVRPFFNDCQVASGTYPCSRLGNNGIDLMGGCSYNSHLSSNRGLPMEPLPSHLGSNNFSFRRNYSSVSGSNVANGHSSESSFLNNAYGFPRAGPFSRQSYVQYDQHSHTSVYQLGSRNQLYTGFPQPNFAEDAAVGAVGFQVTGHSFYSAQSCNGPATTPEKDIKQTSQLANLALPDQSSSFANSGHEPSVSRGNTLGIDVANSDLPAPCSVPSYVHATSGTVSTTTSLPSLVCTGSNTVTLGSDNISRLIASRVAPDGDEDNSLVPVSSSGNAGNENSSSSILNRDLVANSGEGTDNSLLALEQRVAQACALVERVLREREEREQFGREIERKEQMIREERERERREREEREIEEAERWPQHQEAITARSQWLCEHYQRHCRVRFPCCGQFYPCHRCHNNSHACDNQEAKACHATHLQCNHCQHEQEIDENSGTCGKCEGKMSAYFCSICKHFTSVDKNPYHCEKCGICRIHKDKSFHCDVCNVCLDKRLEGNHKCRPDSGHDECCICLEDAFSGCQILPCSHKVHRECAIAMIQNGIRTCPICRHPLYSPSRR